MQAEFERELSRKIRTRRLTMCIISLLCLALFIVSLIIQDASKEVVETSNPAWTFHRYSKDMSTPMTIGLTGSVFFGMMLLIDFIKCGFKTLRKGQQYITIYRGMFCNVVYVNGKEKGHTGFFGNTDVVEAWLDNQVKVTVCFSHTIWYMAHVSFSNESAFREV